MPINPGTSIIDSVLSVLRAMLSRSASFRTLVGAADATAALSFIHPYSGPVDADGVPTRPCAVLMNDPGEKAVFHAFNFWELSATLCINIEAFLEFSFPATTVTDASNLNIAGLAGHGVDFFQGYRLTVVDDDSLANGEYAEILTSDDAGNIVLASPLGVVPDPGDSLLIAPASDTEHMRAFRKIIDGIQSDLLNDTFDGANTSLCFQEISVTEWGRPGYDKEDYYGGLIKCSM